MAENKKSFILYCDQKGIWDKLSDEQAGRLIKHVLRYVNDENPSTDDFIIELAFESIKQQLKRDLKKWENQYNQRVLAGKKSAEVRRRNSTTVDERSISSTVNGNVNVNANVSDNTLTLGNGKYFFSVTSKYLHEKSYIVKGVDGLKLYMELNKSILDFPERHEKFMREVNGDVFNEFMHVRNRFKKFIEKQYA